MSDDAKKACERHSDKMKRLIEKRDFYARIVAKTGDPVSKKKLDEYNNKIIYL